MKNKHENTIMIIGMVTFVLTMILCKVINMSAQKFIIIICWTGCTLGGIYMTYKGSNKMAGASMLCLSSAMFLVILTQYFNNYFIWVPIHAIFVIFFITVYKTMVIDGDKEKINAIKLPCTIGIILSLIIQIAIVILPLFIKF